MKAWNELDRILRGDATRADAVRRNGLDVRLGPTVRACLLLAASYGVCMGVHGIFRADGAEYRQILSSAVKVPALFALTLLVTFPSLYVFNTLLGSRLRPGELVRLVMTGMAVLVAVLAALGPIVSFFSVTTTSYPFILLLNVVTFAAAGFAGLSFLHRALTAVTAARNAPPPAPPQPPAEGYEVVVALPVAIPLPPAGSNAVFYVWMALFGLVGAQMGWVLRPFVGSPDLPFAWFRPRQASFFEAVARSVHLLLGI